MLIVGSHCFQSKIKISTKSRKAHKQHYESEVDDLQKDETHNETSDCIQPAFLTNDIFEKLMSALKTTSVAKMVSDFHSFYEKEAGRVMLSPEQSIRLFTENDFGDKLEEMLLLTRDFLWVSSQDLKNMVLRVRDLGARAKIVTKLFPVLIDRSKVHLETIGDYIDCKSKNIIEELRLEHPRPKDCFFGDLSGNTVFVIDLSGSMMFTFRFLKEYITRLLFLKKLFKRAINSLTSEQKFQIVSFSTNARYIFGGVKDMYAATRPNKDAYIQTVYSLLAGTGENRFTNISEGLRLALEIEQNFDRIIFFTDGLPTVGIRDPDILRKMLVDKNKARVTKGFKEVPVNTNLLMLGKGESHSFREASKYYSKLVAEATNGSLKNFDSEAKK